MRQSVRRWMLGAGTLAAVAAATCGQAAVAGAAVVHQGQAQAASGYTPPSKPLYVGQQGAAVRSVQQRLAQLHYYPGPIDGKYGQDVVEAAWAFREVQGLRMNATLAAQPINRAFEHDLINPKRPYARYPKGGADRIEINQKIEVLVLYQNGEPSVILHVSTGGGYYYPCPPPGSGTCGPAVTPDGQYSALSFAPGWVTVPLGTMYNPVFFIGTAYAIHGDIPVPWYPASHGCVRIWMDAAAWLHKDLHIGGRHPTPIYIYGTAPYYL
ncbi:MAG: L,D-transpeptidase family protein [Streptosporangiaceae bacterium]